MKYFNRRNFIKSSALTAIPALMPFDVFSSVPKTGAGDKLVDTEVKFYFDGRSYEPKEYLDVLQQIDAKSSIQTDIYGKGGAIEALEKKFAALTGKEQAIYMPTGTLANQLAIHELSGDKTKVIVQQLSHIFRDEADAAQSVFHKRLVPLAEDEAYFTKSQLQQAIEKLSASEAFYDGVGAVSIENPVRRAFGAMVPMDEIKQISRYCRENSIRLHLDGARLFLASAWSGVSIKEYCAYFDTVYISLYKYLGAGGGAILCGEASVIAKMQRQIKIHGGNIFNNWTNAAMALHKLENIEIVLANVVQRSAELVDGLNKIKGIKVTAIPNGTNIYMLDLLPAVNANKMRDRLKSEFKIDMRPPNENNQVMITMNETLLNQSLPSVLSAFEKTINS